MLILERTAQWYEWGAGYLEFAGAVGWFMCAVLVWLFRPPRDGAGADHGRSAVWLGLATAFALLALAALASVLDRNGRGWPGAFTVRATGATLGALGAWLLIGLAPVSTWGWRLCALLAAMVPVVQAFTWPEMQPWSAALIYGGGGLWLLTYRAPRRFADPAISAGSVATTLGGALLTLGLGAVATLAAPDTAAPAWVIAVGACATGGAWWWLYLQERTLPHVRERRGPFGMRPRWLLPIVQLLVLVAGCLAQREVVRQAEDFAAQRLVHELRALVSALGPQLPSASSAVAGISPGDAPVWQAGLQALLAASPAYRAAALTPAGTAEAGEPVFARKTGHAPAVEAASLLPHGELEQQAMRAGEIVVRWTSPTRPRDLIVVILPLAGTAKAGGLWQLSVALKARALADVIVFYRLQTFVIVALVALIAGAAVVATVRARNETELRLLKERAELENAARNELLAMVSHEVRTPLQSVLGYAELAAMDALPPAAERHVRAIRGQGAALLRIVQDILDLSALRSGRLELQPEAVALVTLVTEVRQAVAERARRKGLGLSITVGPTAPPIVLVDRVRLLQMLLNLLGNAIKFTVHGNVSLAITSPGPAKDPAQACLEFRVEDTGPGIPAPQLRRVFEPFRKLRDDSAPNSGVGLGLAICQQIVATLHGRITVESREGHGTTFRVELTLPTAPASAVNDIRTLTGVPAEPEIGALTGLRVLLIDDHPLVRDLLRDSLQRFGAHVTACADGATGLATAAHTSPDVVLLDLKLPDRSPEAMVAGLRPPSTAPHEPWIIGLSAGATEAEIQQALGLGMNDFLLKPVSIAGLAETLRLSPAGAKIQKPAQPDAAALVNPRAATPGERASLLAEAAPAIVRIAHACHVGDINRAAAEAHFLANSCVVLGLDAAQQICRTIEDAAEQDDLAAARAALTVLRAEIARAHASATASTP